ncbi:hypothetical protein BV898_09200 [Hypsibius exemplaris]|uniref:Uncharacterized protein n=1 Tax=Hypsibius exemplaris TaxID=2072580 RepID=A0A1W0WND0_HYPEX|nr:hypothetical protein BV898_09200 [Hypsibius exemplaris]
MALRASRLLASSLQTSSFHSVRLAAAGNVLINGSGNHGFAKHDATPRRSLSLTAVTQASHGAHGTGSSGHHDSSKGVVDRSAYESWQLYRTNKNKTWVAKDMTPEEIALESVENRVFFREQFWAEFVDLFRPKSKRRFPRTF